MKNLTIIFLVGFISCIEPQPKNSGKDSTAITDIAFSDTIRYNSGQIKALINKKHNSLNGLCIQFWLNGDTLSTGNYLNGERNGKWIFTFNPLNNFNDSLLPVKHIPVDTTDGNLYSKLVLDFNNYSLKVVSQKIYRSKNSKIKFLVEYKFDKDTIKQMTYWNSDGSKVSTERSLLSGVPHDTSFYWREDGTLEETIILDRGVIIKKRYYDSTGKKIIQEKK